ncbi:hypothetical protein KAT63_04065 [Candidatus Parcubacteria bacterium]|nr:hypothetical protein [Candidatus Parcubacteria bacterium]
MKKCINKIFRSIYPSQYPQEIKNRYGIPEKLELDIAFTKDGYFILTSKDLPGLITEAENGKELIKMFNDAILTYYDVPKREGDIVYDSLNIHGHGIFKMENNKVMQEA